MKTFDYARLNIQREDGAWLCASCGFAGIFDGLAFTRDGPQIGSGICPCCRYEPGFDDIAAASGATQSEPLLALRDYATRWRNAGCRWRGSSLEIPADWDVSRQVTDWTRLAPEELK